MNKHVFSWYLLKILLCGRFDLQYAENVTPRSAFIFHPSILNKPKNEYKSE